MVKIRIDDMEIQAGEDQTVLQVALAHGIQIPHFCFHPRLKVAGNCRMCLVEIEKMPKLQIACGTNVREGMVVLTQTERVKKARQAVMEFLLINHPLDCPVCDQCGECRLQDYSFEYGKVECRYRESRRTFPRMDLGETLVRDMNRCIHCTRCIRFLRDVAGQEELGLAERGGHTEVGTYVEMALESPFSLNLAEVCPVGALTSKLFRFKARPWMMDRTPTLCPGCSRGCNATAWAYRGKLLRFTPRENEAVNRCWMCDFGRRCLDRVHADDRLTWASVRGQRVTRSQAIAALSALLEEARRAGTAGEVWVIASASLTNEELEAVSRLAREGIGTARVGLLAGQPDERAFGPLDTPLSEWFIRKDKFPNSRGARDTLGIEGQETLSALLAARPGSCAGLLVFGEDLGARLGDLAAVRARIGSVPWLVVADSQRSPLSALAQIELPLSGFAEKSGTYTNEAGMAQKLAAVVPAPGEGQSVVSLVSELTRAPRDLEGKGD